MTEAVIVATARSPIGRAFKGSLTTVRPDDLTCQMITAALEPFAVSGPIPWAPPTPAPMPDVSPQWTESAPGSSDELSALVNTVTPGTSPTPVQATKITARGIRTVQVARIKAKKRRRNGAGCGSC